MSPPDSIEPWMVALAIMVPLLGGFSIFARWCAFSPAVSRARLEKMSVGLSLAEVTALLGPSRACKHMPDGSRQCTYGTRMKRHILMVEFNPSGTVKSFAHGIPGARHTGVDPETK